MAKITRHTDYTVVLNETEYSMLQVGLMALKAWIDNGRTAYTDSEVQTLLSTFEANTVRR